MDKEVVAYMYNGILVTIKRNQSESVPERWMNPEPVIQSEIKSHGQGSLACCRPWSHKELDTTEPVN